MTQEKRWIVAIDQGTTGSTVVVMDAQGRGVSRATREFPQHFPRPGWVEHEAEEIYASVLEALAAALDDAPAGARDQIAAIGITNQRETMLLWDRDSGRAEYRALVWQDRRTSARCAEYREHEARVREVTGLVIDPYFSASKLQWVLENEVSLRRAAEENKLAFGTVDSFLIERLSGGKRGELDGPVIEVTNASRTLLMDLRSRTWSDEMCRLWGIPKQLLPRIVPSSGVIAHTQNVPGLPDGIPIAGVAGDQHAALFGQACTQVGQAKCTYGTGAFVLINTGSTPIWNQHGLLSTLGWQIGNQVVYALEGATFIAGAAVQWLRDGLGLIQNAAEIETLAAQVESSDGVVFVPALSGLGAPYWDPEARGVICGLTRGSNKAHLARATLDAIAFQVDDLLRLMNDSLTEQGRAGLRELRVDGGASQNALLMQQQADLSGIVVQRPSDVESTARGAGLLAALGVGMLRDVSEVAEALALERTFAPTWPAQRRREERRRWEQGVARARSDLAAVEPGV